MLASNTKPPLLVYILHEDQHITTESCLCTYGLGRERWDIVVRAPTFLLSATAARKYVGYPITDQTQALHDQNSVRVPLDHRVLFLIRSASVLLQNQRFSTGNQDSSIGNQDSSIEIAPASAGPSQQHACNHNAIFRAFLANRSFLLQNLSF